MVPPLSRLRARLRSRVARPEGQGGPGAEIAPGGAGRPPSCDWAWRPDPWVRPMAPGSVPDVADGAVLAPGVRLFHDGGGSRIAVAQRRAAGEPPRDLRIDAPGFAGSFLSLAVDLPGAAARGLRRSHIVGIAAQLEAARPGAVYLRLNIRQGPNTERRVETAPPGPVARAEFDLGFDAINPVRLEAAWIDLIFAAPLDGPLVIEDLVVTRRPRADL